LDRLFPRVQFASIWQFEIPSGGSTGYPIGCVKDLSKAKTNDKSKTILVLGVFFITDNNLLKFRT
jgi:hypothetical protein